jgi:esterase/lipase superfamily enzyme
MTAPLPRLVLVIVLLVGCATPPEIVGIDNPASPVASVAETSKQRVFIASTREASEVVGALFSDLRADELGLASVDVSIPPTHAVGRIERPRSLPPDPRTEFAIVDPVVYATQAAFVAAIDAGLRPLPLDNRDALFFVHGYNTTTTEAILHVAQFAEDSGFEGASVLFTWASGGKLSRYVYDMNSALVARTHLIDAAQIVARSIARDYHIFAHSMGGLLTMEALVYAIQTDRFDRRGRLRDIVLASPDIDMDLFRAQLETLEGFDRLHVLLSDDDYALRASRLLAGGVPRVGASDAEALADLGVNVIDLTLIQDERSDSHNKFASSPEVVQMIGLGLNTSLDYGANRRTLLDQVIGDAPIRVIGGGG